MTVKEISETLIGKTITDATVNGFEVILYFDDNTIFTYESSDGGYSSYELTNAEEYKWW